MDHLLLSWFEDLNTMTTSHKLRSVVDFVKVSVLRAGYWWTLGRRARGATEGSIFQSTWMSTVRIRREQKPG